MDDSAKTARIESNKLAQEDWRRLCKLQGQFNTEDIQDMVTEYWQRHEIIPECFRDDSDNPTAKRREQRWRQRRGLDLVYGKADKHGLRHGNAIARLRVLMGEPQHRILNWRDIPKLVKYADVPMVQFDPIFMGEANEILRSLMPKTCVYNIEYGTNGLHSHILTGQGVTDLGRLIRVVPDDNLVTVAGYIGKRPLWTPDNAEGYLIIKQGIYSGQLPGRRLPTRLTALGVGVKTGVTLNDIVNMLRHPLTRTKRMPARMSEVDNSARTSQSQRDLEPDKLPEILQDSARMSYAFDDDELMLMGLAS